MYFDFHIEMPTRARRMLVQSFRSIGRKYDHAFFSSIEGIPIVGYIRGATPVVAAYCAPLVDSPGICVTYGAVRLGYWGRGYGTEMLIFLQTKFPRITAYVYKNNLRSLAMCAKVGLKLRRKYDDLYFLSWVSKD